MIVHRCFFMPMQVAPASCAVSLLSAPLLRLPIHGTNPGAGSTEDILIRDTAYLPKLFYTRGIGHRYQMYSINARNYIASVNLHQAPSRIWGSIFLYFP